MLRAIGASGDKPIGHEALSSSDFVTLDVKRRQQQRKRLLSDTSALHESKRRGRWEWPALAEGPPRPQAATSLRVLV